MSTIGSILKDQPTPVTELNRALPRHAGRIIRRCLAKDPDRRYQTALDLRNELEHLKEEIESGELGIDPRETNARPPRRSRPLILFGVAAVLAIAAVFVITAWRRTDPQAPVTTSRPITGTIEQDDDPGNEIAPRWSPDQKYLAYLSSSEPGS